MNDQTNEEIRTEVDSFTKDAAGLLLRIATSEEWRTVLVDGYQKLGDSFLAFLLTQFETADGPDQVFNLYFKALVVDARDEEGAIAKLVELKSRDSTHASTAQELSVSEALSSDEAELRSVLRNRYTFIRTSFGCYVFDLDAITPAHF